MNERRRQNKGISRLSLILPFAVTEAGITFAQKNSQKLKVVDRIIVTSTVYTTGEYHDSKE